MPYNRAENAVRPAPDVTERDIRNVQLTRVLETLLLVVLAVALRDGEPVVDVVQKHAVVGDVADKAASTASCQRGRFLRVRVGPHFDACAFG